MKSGKIILIFLMTAVTTSCKKELNNCASFQIEPISGFSNPPNAVVGQNINIDVTYTLSNGCGRFDSFEEEVNQNNRTVKLKSKYDGCECTQVFVFMHATYSFSSPVAGTHIIRFMGNNGFFLNDTLLIQ